MRDLMGMAAAEVCADLSAWRMVSGVGVRARPAGVPTLSLLMKSSRFMGSDCGSGAWAEDLRNCAIPLGIFAAAWWSGTRLFLFVGHTHKVSTLLPSFLLPQLLQRHEKNNKARPESRQNLEHTVLPRGPPASSAA